MLVQGVNSAYMCNSYMHLVYRTDIMSMNQCTRCAYNFAYNVGKGWCSVITFTLFVKFFDKKPPSPNPELNFKILFLLLLEFLDGIPRVILHILTGSLHYRIAHMYYLME